MRHGMKPVLYIGNRNYSSWSLRPWLVLRWAGVDVETRVIPLGGPGYAKRQMPAILAVSPTGAVPALHVGDDVVCDSLAISEWVAEQVPRLWPADPRARMHARAIVCEMHAGFSALRSNLPCNIRRRAAPRTLGDDVRRDVERIERIWGETHARFANGGSHLFGDTPTIADAFFLPVATRFRTYAVSLGAHAHRYADALLGDSAFREWESAAGAELWAMDQWDGV